MQARAMAMARCDLAGAGSADQHGIALLGQKRAGRQIADQASLIGVSVKSKSSMSLASGSLAMVSWYLIERACFSAISALSRSPTMRGGSCWRLIAGGHHLVVGRPHAERA